MIFQAANGLSACEICIAQGRTKRRALASFVAVFDVGYFDFWEACGGGGCAGWVAHKQKCSHPGR